MAFEICEELSIEIQDKPGALAAVLATITDSGSGVRAFCGYSMGGAGNVMVVPLMSEDKPVAVLVLEQGSGVEKLPSRTVAMIVQFASHATLAIRNAWLRMLRASSGNRAGSVGTVPLRGSLEALVERDAGQPAEFLAQSTDVGLEVHHLIGAVSNGSIGRLYLCVQFTANHFDDLLERPRFA